MRFLFGRGMCSDDTEHTLMVAQALLAHPQDASAFQKALAWKLRWWFVALPAGVGFATARACLKLWIGFPATKAAVRSGGNGPAMRSAIIGAYFADDPVRRRGFVAASTGLTHRGWQAEVAALAVAECVALTLQNHSQPPTAQILAMLQGLSSEPEWHEILSKIDAGLSAGKSVPEFVLSLGLKRGVTGYSLHSVPVAIYAWLHHPGDFRTAMVAVLGCGGDADTLGAILGALMGPSVGEQGIPKEWLNAIWEWPRSIAYMKEVATKLALQPGSNAATGPVRYFWPALIPRNLLFFFTVLFHGFRRLLPPY